MLSQICFFYFFFWLSFYSKVSFPPPHAAANLVPALFQTEQEKVQCCPKKTDTCSWFLGANDGSEWSCWGPVPSNTVRIVWCGPGVVSPQLGPGVQSAGTDWEDCSQKKVRELLTRASSDTCLWGEGCVSMSSSKGKTRCPPADESRVK